MIDSMGLGVWMNGKVLLHVGIRSHPRDLQQRRKKACHVICRVSCKFCYCLYMILLFGVIYVYCYLFPSFRVVVVV